MILADSNLIIYAAGQHVALADWFAENKPLVSAISLVEVLGYHKLRTEEKSVLETLLINVPLG